MKIMHRRTGKVLYENNSTNLNWADLRGADLREASLSEASLRGASLSGANLSEASLRGADLPPTPAIAGIDAKILDAIADPGNALDMSTWHTCETTHCRAGWAIHLAGPAGYKLEDRYGPNVAGALIYAASGSHPVPDWYASNEAALADLRKRAGRSA